ncbi:MAG: bifunctional demethylmenaquinone methyltransferase/2-methoxy-6-polyprenyl-1,4-benzoquinol methylase UbiE [Phycisphaerales bacterium]|nr:MAG: bifunctional demethylmenaquinone methyltransferase/2-methoxy-6-polyprenyl-1,4-benzoquinol methylase UbiE [Phycisphaerales bacterium]
MQKGASTTSNTPRCLEVPVGAMFDRIAPTYDLLNHLLSLGRDFAWRRRAARVLPEQGALKVADLATGTGDLLIALLRERPNVTETVGLDLSEAMLKIGQDKITRGGYADRVRLVHDDALRCGLPAGDFDAVTMAFGIRNTPDVEATLREIRRLLKPGGIAVILEFSLPRGAIMRWCYLVYLRLIVPAIGALLSGSKGAYRYLNESIEAFYRPDDFCELMRRTGFSEVSATPVTWGVASIYAGSKPNGAGDA